MSINSNYRQFNRIVAALFYSLIMSTHPVYAEQPKTGIEAPENWYQVEVILFTQQGNIGNEAPPEESAATATAAASATTATAAATAASVSARQRAPTDCSACASTTCRAAGPKPARSCSLARSVSSAPTSDQAIMLASTPSSSFEVRGIESARVDRPAAYPSALGTKYPKIPDY